MVDSIGLQVLGQGEWMPRSAATHSGNGAKPHLALNAETGEIVTHVLIDEDVGDITAVPSPLARVEGPLASLIADGAEGSDYGRRSLLETAIGRHKRSIGSRLQARSSDSQEGDIAIAVQALNRMIRIAKPISSRPS